MNRARYLLIVLAVIVSFGQTRADEGVQLSGNIQDQNGGALTAAKLTLTNKANAAELKAKPDAEGHFQFESVPEGDYTLKAKAEGFETLEVGVKIHTSEPKPLRLRMELKTHD